MEIETYWEVSPALTANEISILSGAVGNLSHVTEKFDFFVRKQLHEPLCLNIIIVDDRQIKSMNSDYRGKKKATDVLTFPFDETQDDMLRHDMPNYAEIYISQDTAVKQSKEQNLTLLNEFIILIVHGLLHAFHYDHETSKESMTEMRKYEKDVLTYLGINSIAPLTN